MFTALAFLPVHDVIDGFIQLLGDDDLSQKLVSYFETHYIGGERGRGERRRKVESTFPIALWNVFERVEYNRSRTNNSIERYHNALQTSMQICIQIVETYFVSKKGRDFSEKEKV